MQLKEKGQTKRRKVYVKHLTAKPITSKVVDEVTITTQTEPIELYQAFKLHPSQIKALRFIGFSFLSAILFFGVSKLPNPKKDLLIYSFIKIAGIRTENILQENT